jgi:hypothetical protein
VKKLLGLLGTAFIIISIFLALFAPQTFADFWVWTGTRIGQAIMALIEKLPSDETSTAFALKLIVLTGGLG